MADDALVFDQYSGMDHKEGMEAEGESVFVPPYIKDPFDIRRLGFYGHVGAFLETQARQVLRADPSDPNKAGEWREFGDPAVLCGRVSTSVIGDGVTTGIFGADDPIPTEPPIPAAPTPPEEIENEVEQRVAQAAYDAVLAVYESDALAIVERWVADVEARAGLVDRQDWLRAWQKKEAFIATVLEAETEHIVPFGDGVFALGWDSTKSGVTGETRGRVVCKLYDPAVYFPEHGEGDPGEFPKTVHLVWPFTRSRDPETGDALDEPVEMVRKISYRLVPLNGGGEGGTLDTKYQEHKPTETCLLTDSMHRLEDLGDVKSWADWDTAPNVEFSKTVTSIEGTADTEVELQEFPIQLDEIPVIHVPNTLSSSNHFGRSLLSRLFQLFDEIAETDTDASRAARWAGRPPVGVSGMAPGEKELDLSPGKGIKLGDGGRITIVDMAQNLTALGERVQDLLKRLSVNGSVPEGLLGRVDASQVPSGLALTLSFTPFEQLITMLRLARVDKYALLLRTVQRIAIQNSDESLAGDTTVHDSVLQFGSFMPQDLAGVSAIIRSLNEAGAISLETKIKMVAEAGAPVDDETDEAAAIRAGDYKTADGITGATENPEYGAAYLGINNYQPAGAADSIDPEESDPASGLPAFGGPPAE